jgi:hypothetical protein
MQKFEEKFEPVVEKILFLRIVIVQSEVILVDGVDVHIVLGIIQFNK